MERNESYNVRLVVDEELWTMGLQYEVVLVSGGNASECITIIIIIKAYFFSKVQLARGVSVVISY